MGAQPIKKIPIESTRRVKLYDLDINQDADAFRANKYLKAIGKAIEVENDDLIRKTNAVFGFKAIHDIDHSLGLWILNLKAEKKSLVYKPAGITEIRRSF